MALVLRLRDGDKISMKLEDGREIDVCIEVVSKYRMVAYIEAPRSVRVERLHSIKKKELDDRARNPDQ